MDVEVEVEVEQDKDLPEDLSRKLLNPTNYAGIASTLGFLIFQLVEVKQEKD